MNNLFISYILCNSFPRDSRQSKIASHRQPPLFRLLQLLVLLLAFFLNFQPAQADQLLIHPWEANWKYLDNGSDQGTDWRALAFDDSTWLTGLGPLGYGFNVIATNLQHNASSTNPITSYYRHSFNVIDPDLFEGIEMNIMLDDGAVVYLNGTEIYRNNLPTGTISFNTVATTAVAVTSPYDAVQNISLSQTLLQPGNNIIAIELHQTDNVSTDAIFALALRGIYPPEKPGIFERGPYLQTVTPTSAIIRWGTTTKNNSIVHYGNAPDNLALTQSDSTLTYHHEIHLTNLSPASVYYYSTGSDSGNHASGTDYYFKTQPATGTKSPTRIWVIGDSGRNNQTQRDVYQSYLSYTGNRHTDLWFLLGDNAYLYGTDQEYQNAFFNIYPELLRKTALWPSLGNHDGASVYTPTQSGVYYNIFSLPKNAEAGGTPSGTEAYYSYDYGNMHMVVLDAFDVDRSSSGAMANWLETDLADTTADWIIAYWHHPPYSKGSHDSDNGIELIQMRQNLLPILERHGVDLVLTGHSHSYERSKLIQGHYGFSNTYSDDFFALDIGSGNVLNGANAYSKTLPTKPNSGTVYAVVGVSAEASGSGQLNHPAMHYSTYTLGSAVIDIDNQVLTLRFLDTQSTVQDTFTIQKLTNSTDRDGDGIANNSDNCPLNTNTLQTNADNDSQGDVCDVDDDEDGILDTLDIDSSGVFNNAGRDDDGDKIPNAIDAKPLQAEINSPITNNHFDGATIHETIKRSP